MGCRWRMRVRLRSRPVRRRRGLWGWGRLSGGGNRREGRPVGTANDKGREFSVLGRDGVVQGRYGASCGLQGGRQGVRQPGHRLVGARPRDSRRRVPCPAGTVRLRQVHRSPPSYGARGADQRRDHVELRTPRIRLRVSGADVDALVGRVLQRLAASPSGRHVEGEGEAAHRGGAGAGRAVRLRQILSASAVRRHEDAGVDRPRAGDPPGGAADGRALRRAR